MTGVSWAQVLEALGTQLAAFVSVLLLMSALHKGVGRERSLIAVRELGHVPQPLASTALTLAASLELIAALALWSPWYRAAGALLAAFIWSSYLALLLWAVAQGRRHVDCGCSFGAARHPLGAYHLLRNAMLAGGSAAVAVGSIAHDGLAFTATQILAAAALLALYAALDQVMALSAPRTGELL
jgi:hypothetical protein